MSSPDPERASIENATIGMPKSGRLTEETIAWLNEHAGTDFPQDESPFDVRRERTDTATRITIVGYSNGDVVKAVATGQVDIGICGQDKLLELGGKAGNIDFDAAHQLGYGSCRLAIARTQQAAGEPVLRIATSYPGIAEAYARTGADPLIEGMPTIDYYSGGVESVGRRNGYDTIVDVVDTGRSMAANGYEPTDYIAKFQAVLFGIGEADPLEPGEYEELRTESIPLDVARRFLDPALFEQIPAGAER